MIFNQKVLIKISKKSILLSAARNRRFRWKFVTKTPAFSPPLSGGFSFFNLRKFFEIPFIKTHINLS